MGTNFKKFHGGPTPAAEHGRPSDAKTTGTTPVHQTQPGYRQGKHRKKDPGDKHPHSPPDTPHTVTHATLMSPVAKSGELRQQPPAPRILKHQAAENAINPTMGSSQVHSTVQGARHGTSGGESLRPNVIGQSAPGSLRAAMQKDTHMMAGTPRVPHTLGTTKSIRGMIGKPAKKRHRSLYP